MKYFKDESMSTKLAIIDRHTTKNYGHHNWYNDLNDKNKKKADSHFQPIIDRHVI